MNLSQYFGFVKEVPTGSVGITTYFVGLTNYRCVFEMLLVVVNSWYFINV